MLLLLPLLARPAAADEAVHRRLAAMGTALEVTVEAADRVTALAASEAAVRAVEATEARLSTWRADSELSRLNAAPVGQWVALSPALAADLDLASACRAATDGAFDPVVGALVEAWGLRSGGAVPGEAARAAALARTGMDLVEREADRARRLAEVGLDAGAFGKGVALDAALAAARAAGASSVVVDLGGQVAVSGVEVQVDVAVPTHRDRTACSLPLAAGSAATSGHAERPGHLLDPRTGLVAADFGSLTVVAPSAAWADCLSTGLYVLGPDAALAWAADHPEVQVLVVADDGASACTASASPPLNGATP